MKYIVGVRSPIDVFASLRFFLRDHTEPFSKMWGGFPDRSQTYEQFLDFTLVSVGAGKPGMLFIFFFEFVKKWWPYRKYKNVKFIHYKDRLKYPLRDIRELSTFIGEKLTENEVKKVLEVSQFSWMKKNNQKFAYCFNSPIQQITGKLPSNCKCAMEAESFVALGPRRDGEKEYSNEIIEKVRNICLKELNEGICDWLYTGGQIPDIEL